MLQFDTKQNLQRFEGSSSISSDDLFGDNSSSRNNRSSYNSGPDLQEIKDGVRQGVTKVAGKISSLASGVMTSLQVSLVVVIRLCILYYM
jgi:ADP-ribosylation factor GTPase-activating protein 2/3